MTARELLAVFGVTNEKDIAEFQDGVNAVLTRLAEWATLWAEQVQRLVQSIDPSTLKMLAAMAPPESSRNADATGNEAGADEPWWMAVPTISVPSNPEPGISASEAQSLRDQLAELKAQFEQKTGRPVADAFPPKKKPDGGPN
jgi:hypothetical protein